MPDIQLHNLIQVKHIPGIVIRNIDLFSFTVQTLILSQLNVQIVMPGLIQQ
jgi:hypothetical protein